MKPLAYVMTWNSKYNKIDMMGITYTEDRSIDNLLSSFYILDGIITYGTFSKVYIENNIHLILTKDLY